MLHSKLKGSLLSGGPAILHVLLRAGKKEASIAGASVGARTAAKLLGRYGSLEAVLAASAAGQLKGWGPAVQHLLDDSSPNSGGGHREALLRRNRRLFAANSDPAVVGQHGMHQLLAALDKLQPAVRSPAPTASTATSSDCGANSSSAQPPTSCSGSLPIELAWQHPMHVRRWRHLQQQLAAGAVNSLASRLHQAVTLQGLAVDELWESPGAEGAPASGRGATFYVCPCDVAAGSWECAAQAVRRQQQQQPAGGNHTASLMPLLHGAMRHHVQLVKRAGYCVQLRLLPAGEPS